MEENQNKEKLEFLEHEDVETMEKKIDKLRIEESSKERERIASIGKKGRGDTITIKEAGSQPPEKQENKGDFSPKEPSARIPLSQKLLIRGIYLAIISCVAYFFYWKFK